MSLVVFIIKKSSKVELKLIGDYYEFLLNYQYGN